MVVYQIMVKAFDAMAKTKKATWKAMKEAVKYVDKATNILSAFGSASLISKVYDKVIGNYTAYLSNVFWGKIVKGIDFEAITTVITDILGPIFSGIGTIIGDLIEAAPIGTAIGGGLGYVIGSFYGSPIIGGIIGAALGGLIESFYGILGDIVEAAPAGAPYKTEVWKLYEEQTGNKYTGIFDWKYIDWYNNIYLPSLAATPTTGTYGVGIMDPWAGYGGLGGLQEFQLGTPYVPKTGIYGLTKGEAVITAKENRRGSKNEIHIHIDLRNAVVENVDRLSQKIAEQVLIQIG